VTYVITQSCCNDASCVEVCPVDCIHPTPDEPGYGSAEMLYVNPDDCIVCGACVDVCPVSAIYPDYDLPDHLGEYAMVNADYFAYAGNDYEMSVRPGKAAKIDREGPLRVAVVGAGPSGWFVADELNKNRRTEVEVTVIDRLAAPYGLVRHGVAPDHLKTKGAADAFAQVAVSKQTTVRLGLEIGRDVTHADLLETHHAVVYATGTPHGRSLGLPGEDLPGSASAAEFVTWYNGHPDHAAREFDLTHERAVIIGNGNVALDMARLLLLPEERLHESELAPDALEALAGSSVEEVVVLGRRGAEFAAFTSPELRALLNDPDIDLVVDPADASAAESAAEEHDEISPAGFALKQKAALLVAAANRSRSGAKRLVLRFNLTPAEILGEDRVTGLRATDGETIEAGLVLRATGYASEAVADLGVDLPGGRFSHDAGRVLDPSTTERVAGTYTAGWVKRGPSGVIGTNRSCSAETVSSLLDDCAAGALAEPTGGSAELDAMLAERGLPIIDIKGWKALDSFEVGAGAAAGRPRIKVVDAEEQRRIAQAQR
jgi:ferredoxin/flavodoxin---NADP+ reductase